MSSHWAGGGNSIVNNDTYDRELREPKSSTPACAEDLVDGKLALTVNMSAIEKEPLHTGKWSQEEVRELQVTRTKESTIGTV